jgi:hypothetical protein
MESIYCVSIVKLLNKPSFIGKYLVNANYSAETITDILEGEDLNIEIGASHAFEYGGLKYLMHFVSSDELICVVSTKPYKSRLLAQLVVDIKTQYENSQKENKRSYTYLKILGEKYNNPASIDSISRTQNKLNEVKSVMHQNIEMALQHIQKLEDLEIKTQELQQSAGIFKRDAGGLRRKMWWKNMQMKIILAVIILAIIGLITGILCAIYPPNKN